MHKNSNSARVSTGVPGLDEILHGGLVPCRGYLFRGGPGTGKTTLGMHFLQTGVKNGERCLFITLGESEESLKANAAQIGLPADKIEFLDLSPNSDFFAENKTYDLFSPAEVERDPVTKSIVDRVKSVKPQRVFLDSTSHLRYLAIDSQQFRKQLLAFIRFLLEQKATVAFTSEASQSSPDDDVMYLSDGVINVSLADRGRKIEVTKFRGSGFRAGKHTLRLTGSGYQVFPSLRPSEHSRDFAMKQLPTGIEEIDRLLGGGIERGTTTLITGPAGVGKTTLGLQLLRQVATQEEKALLYAFEEAEAILISRAESIGIPVKQMIEDGRLQIRSIEPLLFTADEIADQIRREVEENGAKIVMLDSVAGFRLAVDEEDLVLSMRAIFKYLTNMGVTVIALNEVETITGDFRATEAGISFMVDNIIFIRYLELWGEMRKAIGVLKKRLSDFERNLREFATTNKGIRVGEPLVHLRGILRGTPEWVKAPQKEDSPEPQVKI